LFQVSTQRGMLARISAKGHAGGIVPLDLNHLYLNYISILGSTIHTDADVASSLDVAALGHLGVLIDQVLPLSDAVAAHRLVAGRCAVGKIVLKPW
jgi:NADPH:quinone reductase-like Zn-dependent oxidoreductase